MQIKIKFLHHSSWSGWHWVSKQVPERTQGKKSLLTAGDSKCWCSHLGNQYGGARSVLETLQQRCAHICLLLHCSTAKISSSPHVHQQKSRNMKHRCTGEFYSAREKNEMITLIGKQMEWEPYYIKSSKPNWETNPIVSFVCWTEMCVCVRARVCTCAYVCVRVMKPEGMIGRRNFRGGWRERG